MTLIYATATKDISFFVSDTLLTSDFFKNKGPINGEWHALKIQIISEKIAIAYAGDVEPSIKLIKKVQNELSISSDLEVPSYLFNLLGKLLQTSSVDCEFLILKLTQEGGQLAKVTNKGVGFVESAYIGNADEYNVVNKLKEPYEPPIIRLVQRPDGTFIQEEHRPSSGEIEFSIISAAMEKRLGQRKSESVGAVCGCITRVVDARISGNLEYLQSVEVYQSLEEGHSGYSYLASNNGVRGIGIYYRSGKLGFLFIVGDTEYCRKEQADTIDEFIKLATEKYGLNLSGGVWS